MGRFGFHVYMGPVPGRSLNFAVSVIPLITLVGIAVVT